MISLKKDQIERDDVMLAKNMKQKILRLVKAVWKNPELSGEEFFACAEQVRFLKKEGFTVTAPIAGEKTAYKAEFTIGAKGKKHVPTFAFCSEYDALPKVKHGCGHPLIMGSALTAACCLRELLKKDNIPGRVVLFGCPAEETYGGKLKIAESGAADDVDAFLMAHPTDGEVSFGDLGYAGVRYVNIAFTGSGGSGVPRLANPSFVNTLDASTLLYQAVAMRRHFFPADVNIVGVITNGGERANILPVVSESSYTVRSQNIRRLEDYTQLLRSMAEAAAVLTGTEMTFTPGKFTPPTCHNMPLADAFLAGMEKRGGKIYRTLPHKGFLGATDFGIFSRMRPGCHLHFPIMEKNVAHHTIGFYQASGKTAAVDSMFAAGESMAETAFRFITDPKFRFAVEEEFTKVVSED